MNAVPCPCLHASWPACTTCMRGPPAPRLPTNGRLLPPVCTPPAALSSNLGDKPVKTQLCGRDMVLFRWAGCFKPSACTGHAGCCLVQLSSALPARILRMPGGALPAHISSKLHQQFTVATLLAHRDAEGKPHCIDNTCPHRQAGRCQEGKAVEDVLSFHFTAQFTAAQPLPACLLLPRCGLRRACRGAPLSEGWVEHGKDGHSCVVSVGTRGRAAVPNFGQ